MSAIITLTKVSHTFADPGQDPLVVLKDINLKIADGEIFVFLGPSGSGKSTILRLMSGLEQPTAGQVELRVEPSEVGFVFQQFGLLPWLTVFENIELGLIASGLAAKERAKIVKRELKRLGLQEFAKSRPKDLSGGMRQRVGLARALAREPKVIFMDEPFSELDSFTAKELRRELLNLWRETGAAIVMVTHLVEDAIELADRIAVLTPRPGEIEKIITNKMPRPRNRRSPEAFALEDKLVKLVSP